MVKRKIGKSSLADKGMLYFNHGQPIKKKTPKVRMSKKERLKKRREGRERFGE
ncbi:MAG: hypothetical protein LBU85_09010 [Treponema sp.]|jgi:hypothetical protein|nr:hypothetical protein [Treponema sp.]